jgi:hypothetical protein
MQVAKSAKSKGNGKVKSKGKRKSMRGGAREGAGRPSLYPGKDTSWHATAYFTKEGQKKLEVVQAELLKRHKDLVNSVSVSDAIERGIHLLHRELTRAR